MPSNFDEKNVFWGQYPGNFETKFFSLKIWGHFIQQCTYEVLQSNLIIVLNKLLSFARFPCKASKASLIQNLCELFCTLLIFADSKKVSEFELELKQNDEVRKSLERHVTINEDPTIVKETEERDEWDNKCSFFLSALGFAGMAIN